MIGFYVRFASPILAVFFAVMLFIRAQPYDDHDLRALLMPDDCEMPCFMGIRPGVTTVDEAMHILEASGWVKEINSQKYSSSTVFHWTWNGHRPQIIDEVGPGSVSAKGGTITSLTIRTTMRLGDILMNYGISNWMARVRFDDYSGGYYFGYARKKQIIGIEHIRCNTWNNLIEAKVIVTYTPGVEDYRFETVYNVGLENLRRFARPFQC
jgi:hypothetical protein